MNRIVIYVTLGIIIIIVLEIFIFKTASKKQTVPADTASKNRISMIDSVLKAKFGNAYPFVFIFIFILFIAIFVLLYFVLKKETITWNVSDNNAKLLTRIGLILSVLISLTLVGLGIYAVIRERQTTTQQQQDDGDFSNEAKGNQFLELVGLIIVVVLIIGFIVYKIIEHRRYEKTLTENTS